MSHHTLIKKPENNSLTPPQTDHDNSGKIETKQLDFVRVREWLANNLEEDKAESQMLDRYVNYLKQEEQINYATLRDKLSKPGDEHDIAEELLGYLRKIARKESHETVKGREPPNHIYHKSDVAAPTTEHSYPNSPAEHRDGESTPDMERNRTFDRRDADYARHVTRRRHSDHDRHSEPHPDLRHRRSSQYDRYVEPGRELARDWDAEHTRELEQPRGVEDLRSFDNRRDRERVDPEHPRDLDYFRGRKYREPEHPHRSDYKNSERRLDSERYEDAEQYLDLNRPHYSERASRKDENGSRGGRYAYEEEQSKSKRRGDRDRGVAQGMRLLGDAAATPDDRMRQENEGEDVKEAGAPIDFIDERDKKEPVPRNADKAHGVERSYADIDSLEPSEDGRHHSKRHWRRSRSRSRSHSDRVDSHLRRHRRRRRRHEDEDDDDREYRRHRRRHRRRSLSRSRSPRRTLSEERERERRREERRARRRERELMREEDRERRRARKRRLDPEELEDRDVIKRDEDAQLRREDRSRGEYYDEHEYRRHRRKRRRRLEEPWDNESLSDADLSDGRYHDRRRRHRHRHERDYYDDDNRRLKGAFHKRHDEYIGDHDNEHPVNGDFRRQLPAAHDRDKNSRPEHQHDELHSSSRMCDRRRESYISQKDTHDSQNDLRKIQTGNENHDESQRASMPHYVDRRGETRHGKQGVGHAETELEPTPRSDIPLKNHQVAKRAHVTSRLGKIEPRGIKSSEVVGYLPQGEGAELHSGSAPWDGKSTKQSFKQGRSSLKEKVKSKVNSTVLDRLRSKALASMNKKSSATDDEETIWTQKT